MGTSIHSRSDRFSSFVRPLLLLVVYSLVHLVFFRQLGRFIVDAGKELVTPWLLMDGQVLYRDVFWVYGPWAPYFNSGLYELFGAHADVLLWLAKILGATVVLGVYRCLTNLVSPNTAWLAALSVLAFSTTSNYFAWPYSFSNLWATALSLFAVDALIRWQMGRKPGYLWLATTLATLVIWSKFIIAFPLLVALWGMVLAGLWCPVPTTDKGPNPLQAALVCTVCVLGAFAFSVWYFGTLTPAASYRLQLGALFHARHLAEAGLYDRLRETILLQNGFNAENLFAAAAVLLSPLALGFSLYTWLRFWRKLPASRKSLLMASPCLIFASGSLLQLNSSVHAPYVYPATAITLFFSLDLWQRQASPALFKWIKLLLLAILTFCLSLGLGRMVKSLNPETGVMVETLRFKFRWAKPNGPVIQNISAAIQERTAASDRIIVFSPHDFLYLLSDRKPAMGYLYTWYEPFHDTEAEKKVIETLTSGKIPLVITHLEDPFSLTFVPDHRSHPIYQALRLNYEPKMNPARWDKFVLWERKTTTTGPSPGDRQE